MVLENTHARTCKTHTPYVTLVQSLLSRHTARVSGAKCKCVCSLGERESESTEPWKLVAQVFSSSPNSAGSTVARSHALTFYRVTVVKGTQTSRELRSRRVLKALKFPQLLSSPVCPAAAAVAAEATGTGPEITEVTLNVKVGKCSSDCGCISVKKNASQWHASRQRLMHDISALVQRVIFITDLPF